MTALGKRLWPSVGIFLASVFMVSRISSMGDWPFDSWPAITALEHGHPGDYLSAKAMMGIFSTLVQTPFAAAAGAGSQLTVYKLASLPCVLAAGALGIYLASLARRRGVSAVGQWSIAGLCVVNPLTLAALQGGHPEEILTAALAVGAVAAAADGRRVWAAILLGLALASKQWAVIAILPTLMALPGRRFSVAVGALAIAAAFTLPPLIVAPQTFGEVHDNAANTGRAITPESIWYPLASVKTEVVAKQPEVLVARVHTAPAPVGALSHPLIVLLAFALPLLLARSRGGFQLDGGDAMALLALLALLRCALDPVDNIYYLEPLLLALLGWDALSSRSLPVRSLLGVAAALMLRQWSLHLDDVSTYNYAYIALFAGVGGMIGIFLWRPKTPTSSGAPASTGSVEGTCYGDAHGSSGRPRATSEPLEVPGPG
jgi:hypothetical protein